MKHGRDTVTDETQIGKPGRIMDSLKNTNTNVIFYLTSPEVDKKNV